MRIHYREKNGKIEIVRCFGEEPMIVLPDHIDGKEVAYTSAYAFSARKEKEEGDVSVCESSAGGYLEHADNGTELPVLAGEVVEQVLFPDTMESIGNYIFYGCRNLRELTFSNRLMQIGSGAFTGCHALQKLTIHMTDGKKSCAKEILGDLWQRIDIRFCGEEEARLVFPEHYEEAVENTPARILFTQHHGSGNNYRQCFYNKEMDYRKYDELFPVAKAQDHIADLADLVFSRLLWPVHLSERAEQEYIRYVEAHAGQLAEYLVQKDWREALSEFSRRGLWTREAIDTAIECASRQRRQELLSVLMDEKNSLYPAARKRYEL